MNRAGAQDDAAGPDLDPLPVDACPHPHRTSRLDQNLVDVVHPLPQFSEIAEPAQVAIVGFLVARAATRADAVRREAGAGRGVVVKAPPVADLRCGRGECVVGGIEVLAAEPQHGDRSVGAVIWRVAEVEIAFKPAPVREDVIEGPSGTAE